MAIGSNPEVGTTFKSCKDFTMEDWENWWTYMRNNWGKYLQAGYATLVHNKNNRYYGTQHQNPTQKETQTHNHTTQPQHPA